MGSTVTDRQCDLLHRGVAVLRHVVVPHKQSHRQEWAIEKTIAAGGIEALVRAMKRLPPARDGVESDVGHMWGCAALGAIANNEARRLLVAEAGGAAAVVAAINAAPDNAMLVESACAALWNIGAEPSAAPLVAAQEGPRIVVEAMGRHVAVADVVQEGCGALRDMAMVPLLHSQIVVAGGVAACCAALRRHVDNAQVCEFACGALGRLLSTEAEPADPSANAEGATLGVLLDAMATHRAVELAVASMRTHEARSVDLDTEATFFLDVMLSSLMKRSPRAQESEAELEAQFDSFLACATAAGELTEIACDELTDEVAACRDSAARCATMRQLMGGRLTGDKSGEALAEASLLAPHNMDVSTRQSLQTFARSGAVAASVEALMGMVAAREMEPIEADVEEDDEPAIFPCKLLAKLGMIEMPECRKALMAGSEAVPTAYALVYAFDQLVARKVPSATAAGGSSQRMQVGKAASMVTQALFRFARCGPDYEAALLEVDGIDEFTSCLLREHI